MNRITLEVLLLVRLSRTPDMDEVNKILERLMARPTYVDDIRKLAMSVYLWMRQKPLVAILIVALFLLTVSIGNSLVLIVIFFATILYT